MDKPGITEEMVDAATKSIILQMQCCDFGRLTDDGDFVTTSVKIELLEARAKEAARAALEAALSPAFERQEPVAWQWRMRHPAVESWTEWREGRANFSDDVAFLWEERPLFASPVNETEGMREALRELSDYIKFHKASVLDGMTKREMNALMDVLHRSNAALGRKP